MISAIVEIHRLCVKKMSKTKPDSIGNTGRTFLIIFSIFFSVFFNSHAEEPPLWMTNFNSDTFFQWLLEASHIEPETNLKKNGKSKEGTKEEGKIILLPGYSEGEVQIVNVDPEISEGKDKAAEPTDPRFSIIDMKVKEKRSTLFSVALDSINRYYVDIIRSDQPDNDFIFQGVGKSLVIRNKEGNLFKAINIDSLPLPKYQDGYKNFTSPKKWMNSGESIIADWEIGSDSPAKSLRLWQIATPYRDYYTVAAPSPVLLARQNGVNGADYPFVNVIEPVTDNEFVRNVEVLDSNANHTFLKIALKDGTTDYILISTNGGYYTYHGVTLNGAGGIIRTKNGKVTDMYLVNGTQLSSGRYSIISPSKKSISKSFNK